MIHYNTSQFQTIKASAETTKHPFKGREKFQVYESSRKTPLHESDWLRTGGVVHTGAGHVPRHIYHQLHDSRVRSSGYTQLASVYYSKTINSFESIHIQQ